MPEVTGRRWLALALVPLCGCGATLQTMYGWTERVQRESTRTYPVRVETLPEGARVIRADASGEQLALGLSPLVDPVRVPVAETVEVAKSTVPMWIGGALDGVLAFFSGGAFGVNVRRPDPDSQGRASLLFVIFISAASAAFADLVFAAIFTNQPDRVVAVTPVDGGVRTSYLVDKDGWSSMLGAIKVPWELSLSLQLKPALIVVPPLSSSSSTAPSLEQMDDEPGGAKR